MTWAANLQHPDSKYWNNVLKSSKQTDWTENGLQSGPVVSSLLKGGFMFYVCLWLKAGWKVSSTSKLKMSDHAFRDELF